MPPKKKVTPLSATLQKLLASRGLAARLTEYRLAGRWEQAVGAAIARHTQPTTIRGKKLTVVVDSSAWMQQLALLRPEIIAKVNAELGGNAIDSITLKLGEVAARRSPQRAPVRSPVPLGPEERAQIDVFVQAVADPGARDALRHLIEKDFQYRKGGRSG